MKVIKGNGQLFAEGQRFERAGQLEDAAAAYQRVVDTDPRNQEVVARLLVVYRRLKDYGGELAVIDAALEAIAERDQAAQDKWIAAHPEAAQVGKAFLRKLGGQSVTTYGTGPLVERWLKRKALVQKKIGGGKQAGAATKKSKTRKGEKPVQAAADKRRQQANDRRAALAATRKKATEERKRVEREKKAAAATVRKEKAEERRQEAAARKAAREAKVQKEKEARAHPSLFIVSLRYLVPLAEMDTVMEKHVAFLDKHFAEGHFLVSGRQVPRIGGIILARGKDWAAVDRIMKQDPLVKGKLAGVDIVEFVASKKGKGLEGWVRGGTSK